MYPGCEHAVSASAGVAVTAAATATAQDCSTLHSPILTGLLWCLCVDVLHTVVQIERRNEEQRQRQRRRRRPRLPSTGLISSIQPVNRVSRAWMSAEIRASDTEIALRIFCCDAIPAADLAAAVARHYRLLRPDATRVHIGHTWTAGGGYYLSPPEGQSACVHCAYPDLCAVRLIHFTPLSPICPSVPHTQAIPSPLGPRSISPGRPLTISTTPAVGRSSPASRS